MEKRYVVGDIHGNARAFISLLEYVDPDPEELVLLGDLGDRGLDTWGVFHECSMLLDEGCDIVMGNHDAWLRQVLTGQLRKSDFESEQIGGLTTLKSFELATNRIGKKKVDDTITKVLSGMKPYIETDDYIFVHAGLDPRVPYMDQQKPDVLMMGCHDWKNPKLTHCYEQEVVYGHTPTWHIHKAIQEDDARIWSSARAKKIALDTGAGFRSRLTLADLKDGIAYAWDFAKREIITYQFRRAR